MAERVPIAVAEHGQTAYDKAHRVHAEIDSPLNETGRHEAARLGRKLKSLKPLPEMIYASPLKRAQQTAEIASRESGIPMRTSPGLRALKIGDLGGIDEKDAEEKLGPYFDDPRKPLPGSGGATVTGWRKKILDTMRDIADRHDAAAVVTHSNVHGVIDAHARGTENGLKKMAHPPAGGSVRVVRYPTR